MFALVLFIAIAVGVLSVIISNYLSIPRISDQGVCPDGFEFSSTQLSKQNFLDYPETEYGECFFSTDYYAAAVRFKELASKAGATILNMHVVDDLYTDVAIFEGKGDKKDRVLVHQSGTHGPESYVGSAVQLAALKYLSFNGLYTDHADSTDYDQVQNIPTIVFVHALNPYGFKTHRRVNENSIDQNRNFLDSEEEWAEARALDENYAGHLTFSSYLNPTARPFPPILGALNDMVRLLRGLYIKLVYGEALLKRALVSGNYRNPHGYEFGGLTWSQSALNLRRLLLEQLRLQERVERLVFVDVHTGLGPSAVDTLIFSDDTDPALAGAVFPTEYAAAAGSREKDGQAMAEALGGLKTTLGPKEEQNEDAAGRDAASAAVAEGVSSGYELVRGTVTSHFCARQLAATLPPKQKLCVTQEIGTYSPVMVGMALLEEHYAFHHGTEEEKARGAQLLKNMFYVESREWKRRTVHRGMTVFLQALDYLNTD